MLGLLCWSISVILLRGELLVDLLEEEEEGNNTCLTVLEVVSKSGLGRD